MNRRIFALAGVAIFIAPTFAVGQPTERSVDANRVFANLLDYYRLPAADRTRFHPAYRLRPETGATVSVSLLSGGVRRPLDLGPDGRVLNPPTAAELQNDAQVIVSSAARMSSGVTLEPTLLLATTMAAADAVAAINQANVAIGRFAGALGLFAPRVRGVSFTASASAAAAALLSDGRRTSLFYRNEVFEFRPADARGASQLIFSVAPSSAAFME
ncbi:MAG: hypothetical protein NW206_08140 [Hyphomonadaceae bacterium]|nr:hypothetical protein [Hyphomonadaceae bacterium]